MCSLVALTSLHTETEISFWRKFRTGCNGSCHGIYSGGNFVKITIILFKFRYGVNVFSFNASNSLFSKDVSDRTQVGPMLAPWTLLSGELITDRGIESLQLCEPVSWAFVTHLRQSLHGSCDHACYKRGLKLKILINFPYCFRWNRQRPVVSRYTVYAPVLWRHRWLRSCRN